MVPLIMVPDRTDIMTWRAKVIEPVTVRMHILILSLSDVSIRSVAGGAGGHQARQQTGGWNMTREYIYHPKITIGQARAALNHLAIAIAADSVDDIV